MQVCSHSVAVQCACYQNPGANQAWSIGGQHSSKAGTQAVILEANITSGSTMAHIQELA